MIPTSTTFTLMCAGPIEQNHALPRAANEAGIEIIVLGRQPRVRYRSVHEMIEYTSIIEAAFQNEGRGCVLAPGIPRNTESHVKPGDHIYILQEQRTCIDTVVRGIETIRAQPSLTGFPILLPKTITKDDIPIGAVLHIVEHSPRDGVRQNSHFNVGDRVSVRLNARNYSPHLGQIDRQIWHHKFQLWYYCLRDTRGRKVSKRYTAADLSLIGDRAER